MRGGSSNLLMEHLASFSISGAYSSVVISTKLPYEVWRGKVETYSWLEDYIQVAQSTFFLSLGSDAVNQLISFYLHTRIVPEDRQCHRFVRGDFESNGELVYVESIDGMSFTGHQSFFLPNGSYSVECRSWNIENGVDVFEPYIDTMVQNIRHEIAFIRRSEQE